MPTPDDTSPARDDLLSDYLAELSYDPYPVQEEALLAWFESDEGVLVCAPTGTGKTLIAEAAMYEALKTGKTAYYTTPLIALTDQKFEELQDAAERWGFERDSVGLVTGNRKVNPKATVLVVVAEILLNRLLHPEGFDFSEVSAVVMDEFHSFNDPERGIVWELSLGILPKHVRLMLLSATVGNAVEFLAWLRNAHGKNLRLVQGSERKVPLTYHWVGDQLLSEQLELMAEGDDNTSHTPALVFCFNRNECWDVAEQLKGKSLVTSERQRELQKELDSLDFSTGVGTKLKQILVRGVGVHHAGIVPKYRRIVEDLFQRKLLSVCVCTETLAAGMNLPARSVLLTTLLKGPKGKKKLVEPSGAHQMFGRAGRPQFDTQGHVFAIAHEDDVKIARFMEKYDAIPDDSKDPLVIKAKKRMKKKMPTRRSTEQYWSEAMFEQLQQASPANLASRGPIPWRLLGYLLTLSPEVGHIKEALHKRLQTPKQKEQAEKTLFKMLKVLWAGEFVTLDPEPKPLKRVLPVRKDDEQKPESEPEPEAGGMLLGALLKEADVTSPNEKKQAAKSDEQEESDGDPEPVTATPTERMRTFMAFRAVNPVYASWLVDQFDIADADERLQLFESVLSMPRSVREVYSFPRIEELPTGPLAETRLEPELLSLGLATAEEIQGNEDAERRFDYVPRMPLAEKAARLFRADFPGVHGVTINPIWCAGELLRFGGNFDKYIKGRDLQKQEGMIFRHLLRLVLLLDEFASVCPPGWEHDAWKDDLRALQEQLTDGCRQVDAESTEKMIEEERRKDEIEAEEANADAWLSRAWF